MAELQTHFDEFRLVLVEQIRTLNSSDPQAYTTPWFLLKYFKRIHKKVTVSTSPREVENTIRALIRFYVDSIDKDSKLDEAVKAVLRSHRRSLQLDRRG